MAVTISRPDLESLIGPECTAWLLAKYGGLSLYVPKRPNAGQAILDVIGSRAFEALKAKFGGENLSLPGKLKPPTLKERIIPMIESGMSHNEIAMELGCSWRHVAGVKQSMGLARPTPRKKRRQKPRREVTANA